MECYVPIKRRNPASYDNGEDNKRKINYAK